MNLDDWPDVAAYGNDGKDYSHLGLAHCRTCGLRGEHECITGSTLRHSSPIAALEDEAPDPSWAQRNPDKRFAVRPRSRGRAR